MHDAALVVGEVAQFAIERLEIGAEGSGTHHLRFEDSGQVIEADLDYVIEDYEGHGLVFFVLGLRSSGDPLPPLADE